MIRRQDQDQLYELSTVIMNIIRSPTSPTHSLPARSARRLPEITPAGFASMLLGISMAMMLCGSVTFFIGFLMMPWVLGLIIILYVVGIVSGVSMIWRAVFSGCLFSPVDSIRKEASARKLL